MAQKGKDKGEYTLTITEQMTRSDLETCVTNYVGKYGRITPENGTGGKDFNGDGSVSYSAALWMVKRWILNNGLPLDVPEIADLADFEFIQDAVAKLWGE